MLLGPTHALLIADGVLCLVTRESYLSELIQENRKRKDRVLAGRSVCSRARLDELNDLAFRHCLSA